MLMSLFYISVIAINVSALVYDQLYVDIPMAPKLQEQGYPLKNRLLFMTIWGLCLQTLFYFVALLNECFGTREAHPKKKPAIRIVKDLLFSLAFSVALYVFVAFWALYAVDRELILPEVVRQRVPVWVNHVMHTMILPFILIELLLSSRTYPPRALGVIMSLTFSVLYLCNLSLSSMKTGTWIYPFLDAIEDLPRKGFFALSITSGVIMYLIGEKLNLLVKGKDSKVKNR